MNDELSAVFDDDIENCYVDGSYIQRAENNSNDILAVGVYYQNSSKRQELTSLLLPCMCSNVHISNS